MPCLIALLAFFLPRLTLFLVYLFSDYLSRAFQTALWPLLGFFFMPYTTLAYAFAINSNGSVSGIYLVLVVVAVLCDLGALGGGESARRRRGRRPAAS
jgi:CDP-diglyceride synthetase